MNVATVSDFAGGLNLRDKPDRVKSSEAVDLLNVVFTKRGGVAQRSGYSALTGSALTNRVDSMAPFYTTAGTKQIVAGCGTRLEAISTAGAVVASSTGATQGPWNFARFGSPGNERMYCGNGVDTLRRWTGSAWSSPTATVDAVGGRAMPKAFGLCVQPKDNRLVAAGYSTATGGPNGATSNWDYVYFSSAGDPEAWTTTHYVQLTPSDGEKIQAAVSFGDSVYVFKETKFFIFYGNSTDATGQPVFNYRTVDTGIGLAAPGAVTVAKEGIYFLGRNGVYFTSGSTPTLLSDIIEPIFSGGVPSAFNSSTLNQGSIAKARMTTWNDRVYLAIPTGASTSNDRVLVYDPEFKWWSLWDIPAAALCKFRVTDDEELAFGYSTGSQYVGRHEESLTSDAGAAILSRWYSGWDDFGEGSMKRVRQTKLWGTGSTLFCVNKDFLQSVPSATVTFDSTDTWGDGTGADTWGDGTGTDTWGPGPEVSPQLHRVAVRGTYLQLAMENSALNERWALARADLHVASPRIPEVKEAD